MKKIFDGLLYDTDKATFLCSFPNTDVFSYDIRKPQTVSILQKLEWFNFNSRQGLIMYYFVFRSTIQKIPFIVGVYVHWDESKEIRDYLSNEMIFFSDVFIENLKADAPSLELLLQPLTEKQTSKICEEHLSVEEYMEYFPVEEA